MTLAEALAIRTELLLAALACLYTAVLMTFVRLVAYGERAR